MRFSLEWIKDYVDPGLEPPEVGRRLTEVGIPMDGLERHGTDTVFDFDVTARRALGRHWEERTAAERERFVQLFSGLIDRAYLRRVDKLDGEQIVLVGSAVNGDDATVQTRVVTRDKSQMPVEFLMLRTPADRWRVWDVRVGGMSLVGSYRAQFHKIIAAESYDELVRRLESKVAGEP